MEDVVEKFKLQLMGSDPPFWATRLYPQFFGKDGDRGDTYDIDEPDVEWVMPEMTEEQIEKMLAEMMAKDPSAMTFDEYDETQAQEDW